MDSSPAANTWFLRHFRKIKKAKKEQGQQMKIEIENRQNLLQKYSNLLVKISHCATKVDIAKYFARISLGFKI